jgi:hypothetical protein
MISDAARFSKAAALCRHKAAKSSNPAKWLGYAREWDTLAEWADMWAQYPEVVSAVANALQALSKASKRTGAESRPGASAVHAPLTSSSTQ